MRIISSALLLLAATAMGADPPEKPTPDEMNAVHKRMGDHFLLAWRARAAVLRGDVEGAKAEGKKLAALDHRGLPKSWRSPLSELEQAGRELSSVPNVEMAAESVGRIGQICADCHATLGGGPKLEADTTPAPEWSEASHMPRHLWASEWMWLGVIANDDGAMLRGAKALAGGPLLDVEVSEDSERAEAEAEVHRIASEMVAAKDLGGRIELYGALIGQCGSCHLALEAEGRTPQ